MHNSKSGTDRADTLFNIPQPLDQVLVNKWRFWSKDQLILFFLHPGA